MDPLALILVLSAALCHAVWNLFAKRASDGGTVFVWLNSVVGVVVYLPLVIAVFIIAPPKLTWLLPTVMIVTGLLHLGYTVVLQHGYRVGDMSVVYPLARGTGPALAVLFAIIVWHENPGGWGIVGAAAVVVGILIIGLGRDENGSRSLSAGVRYGLLTGALIASYTVWDAWAVGPLAISPLIYDWGSTLTRGVALMPYAMRRRDEVRRVWNKHRVPIFVVGIAAPAAYMLVLFAYRYAPVSMVAPARETSIVIATLFAWLLLREPQAGRRILGAVVVLLGVAALAIPT